MATSPGLTATLTPPKQQQSQEPTKDSPVDKNKELLQKYGKRLIDASTKKRDSWQWKRRGIVEKALKNKEMLKGNQHMGIFPGTFNTFDAMEEFNNFTGVDDKNGDQSMDRRPHNYYQMLDVWENQKSVSHTT